MACLIHFIGHIILNHHYQTHYLLHSPSNEGALCKGGNGMYETRLFYFEHLDYMRLEDLNYCRIGEVFEKMGRLGKKRLRKAARMQSTYYGLED